VAEAGDPAVGAQPPGDRRDRVPPLHHLGEQAVHEVAGRSVQRTLQRGQPGLHDGVRMRPGRGGHPRRERRGGEVVIGEQHQGGVQGGDARRRGRARGEPGPQHLGQPLPRRSGTADRERRDHRAQDRAAPGDDRSRGGVGAQRVGGGHSGDRDPEPVGRPGTRRQRSRDGLGQRAQLRIGHHRDVLRPPGPQQLGHRLERRRGGELARVVAAVEQLVAGDQRDAGVDRRGVRHGARALAARHEGGHLGLGEQTLLAVGVAPAAEQTPADVRVDRRLLDPQPARDLLGGEQPLRSHVVIFSC
jgi:hypothetical protein